MGEEVRSGIAAENCSYFSLLRILKSSVVTRVEDTNPYYSDTTYGLVWGRDLDDDST